MLLSFVFYLLTFIFCLPLHFCLAADIFCIFLILYAASGWTPADGQPFFLFLSATLSWTQQTNLEISRFCLPQQAEPSRQILYFQHFVCHSKLNSADKFNICLILSAAASWTQQTNLIFSTFCLPQQAEPSRQFNICLILSAAATLTQQTNLIFAWFCLP